ncbi:MAG: hypothetical protein ACK4KW_15155, partial [Gemmobacter sp.]
RTEAAEQARIALQRKRQARVRQMLAKQTNTLELAPAVGAEAAGARAGKRERDGSEGLEGSAKRQRQTGHAGVLVVDGAGSDSESEQFSGPGEQPGDESADDGASRDEAGVGADSDASSDAADADSDADSDAGSSEVSDEEA